MAAEYLNEMVDMHARGYQDGFASGHAAGSADMAACLRAFISTLRDSPNIVTLGQIERELDRLESLGAACEICREPIRYQSDERRWIHVRDEPHRMHIAEGPGRWTAI